MSGKTIATIYFYIISVGSIILMVIGIFNAANFIVNSTQFEQYPLRWGGITSCDYGADGLVPVARGPMSVKVLPPDGIESTPSAQEIQRAKEQCLKNEAADRKQHQVDDIKNAITFSLVGIILFLIHFPQARKRSV
ncbi:hypothetical protein A3F00_01710 [Candidatus Daviesbacteria bacterium RIFCSPHIGHO2_12_FULL_37_11]|uniref:DUF5671 domain-containing protein n=1 Tax=Candidatus Daviesbacteria bacterium RIFCSPHIGHO2_12_FULL_37_11 TaxID=1797777 RepID=A0A1F5KCJ5_9BACT|nr:MAG: hypothetical protein A2111_01565 [Candidatus Daviesbacteria bacterium GWA1_38_6]OGE16494.1 MAG: hypothetical protein A2769_02355 [Candidatus Daviesbacteria bacterium RIFCSPHIGHO2_01_FULL_37_27]OGE38589.1 MAG: hypothetical protein A3F00_01710 [Candidatus Daviesbacteria bacterium RIFCSPHIGHO2_12_FULL_37_11]OGE46300.1 MAG: hypothetical protein A3B39_03935 [Candidatus Daviesbacteria bacterium RIFCSPLOWO2_01_FULL_37_10]